MSARVVGDAAALQALVGQQVGVSPWLRIDQRRIDEFAHATRDEQWIHVDPDRAAAGPFGRTIAHGYLTVSLIPSFSREIFEITFGSARLNYGLENVRFPAAVPVGSRVRASAQVLSVEPAGKGLQLRTRYTVEVEGSERPACVATQITVIVT